MLAGFRRKYDNMTLFQKIRLSILLFSVFPIILLFIFLIFQSSVRREKAVEEEMRTQMTEVFDAMAYKMNTIELLSKSIFSDTWFTAEVSRVVTDNSLGEYERLTFQKLTLSVLKTVSSNNQIQASRLHLDYPNMREYLPYLYRMDRAAGSIWYAEKSELSIQGDWYFNVMDGQAKSLYSGYFVGDNMASYVMPVWITNELEAIYEVVMPMNDLIPIIYKKEDDADVILIDSKGKLYGIDNDIGIFTSMEDLERMLGIPSLHNYQIDGVKVWHIWKDSRPLMLLAQKHAGKDIWLIKATYMDQQYKNGIEEIMKIMLVGGLIFGVLLWSVNSIVKKLLNDFSVFSNCVRRVGEGGLDVRIPRLRQVEINALAEEYNGMLENVKKLTQDNIKREVLIKDMQLKALEKQIDAHFLYNVLESIKMMAEVRGMFQVSDALLALGRMFRYNLETGSHNVTLAEEIIYLESYLQLSNIRLDYIIQLSENIEDSVRALKVPKMILQPIAENSILYGLNGLSEDTTIYLKAFLKGKDACIEMTDMGRGMDEKFLESVRKKINKRDDEEKGGIGLHNIHERIRLMYGDGYGVQIYSKKDCYTKVSILISAGDKYE